MRTHWLQPWKKPDYLEWALPQPWGYLIILARKQPKNWLLAIAKWVFAEEGLPTFEVKTKKIVKTKKEALTQLDAWKKTYKHSFTTTQF